MKNLAIFLTLYVTSISALQIDPLSGRDSGLCQGADPTQNTYWPYPGDCTRYVECFDNAASIVQCADGLWWHQEIQNCDYPGEYCNYNSVPTDITRPPTTQSPPTTPSLGPDPRCATGENQYWDHPTLCSRYIECFEGNSYEMTCPPGLFFSESRQECVNPDESECCTTSTC